MRNVKINTNTKYQLTTNIEPVTHEKAYVYWQRIINICYNPDTHGLSKNSYLRGASLSKEWHHFDNFKRWFDRHFVEGYVLSFSLNTKNSKLYGVETCDFIPRKVSRKIINFNKNKQNGVGILKAGKKFKVRIRDPRLGRNAGKITVGTFEKKEDAIAASNKKNKELIIDSFKEQLSVRALTKLHKQLER